MSSKRTKSSKAGSRKVSKPKDDPISAAARSFLYECPGGMDTNKKRDKFLAVAKRNEQKGYEP